MTDSRATRFRRVILAIDRVILAVAVIAVFSLLFEWGWGAALAGWYERVSLALSALVVVFFLFENFARLFLADSAIRYARDNVFDLALTAAFIVLLFAIRYVYYATGVGLQLRLVGITLRDAYILLGQGYILLTLVSKAVVFQKYLASAGIRPAAFVVLTFAFTITIGTVLLSSPHAVNPVVLAAEGSLSPVDALFTASSAVCVTGLIVKDTGAYFSLFGQTVILVLIQIGGLGLMTFVTFSSLLIGKGLALHERVVMQDFLSYDVAARLPRLVTYILLITFGSEALGVAVLYPVWAGPITSWERLYYSVFHSISAFCNAGFSLFPNSFVGYRGSIVLNVTVPALVIWGGLGFIVQREVISRVWSMMKPRWSPRTRLLKNLSVGETPLFLSLQTRLVLVTTVTLLAAGMVLFALLEWNGELASLPIKQKILASWFQSVTPRTAGFNTVGLFSLGTSTYLLLMALMFIGASPGGTGGGVKTSTVAVLFATISSTLRQRHDVEVMKRSVPGETVRQAVMVSILALSMVLLGVFVLGTAEKGIPFERLLFEEISAFGTVGLSPGLPDSPLSLSAAFTWVGKLVIIVTMFAGRIGPLTLIIAIAQRRYGVSYEYPTERVVIG